MSMSKMAAAGVVSGVVLLTTVLMAQGSAPAQGTAPARGTAPAARGTAPARGAAPTEGSEATQPPVLMGPRGMVPVINRLPATTLHGTIMEITCFRTMGAASISTPEHLACAKAALAKSTGVVGILTDGIGTFQLAGSLTANNFARLVPLIGKDVDLSGQEAYISNNFSYHVFEAMKLTPAAVKK